MGEIKILKSGGGISVIKMIVLPKIMFLIQIISVLTIKYNVSNGKKIYLNLHGKEKTC